jgi:SEC-C motif domain protein
MPQADAPITAKAKAANCPCGSERSLVDCCLPLISGEKFAQTAEQLMRSRYTAHVLLQIDYLWQTWSADQRQRSSPEQIYAWASGCEWLGLHILACEQGQPRDAQGEVSFIALFRQNGQLQQHHEKSLFRKLMGRWFYVDHQAS